MYSEPGQPEAELTTFHPGSCYCPVNALDGNTAVEASRRPVSVCVLRLLPTLTANGSRRKKGWLQGTLGGEAPRLLPVPGSGWEPPLGMVGWGRGGRGAGLARRGWRSRKAGKTARKEMERAMGHRGRRTASDCARDGERDGNGKSHETRLW